MSVTNYVYVLLRVNEEYPVKAVFRNMEDAHRYRADLIKQMREDGDIADYLDDDEVFDIVRRPLVNAIGEEI